MKEKELEKVFKALANKRRLAALSFIKKKKQANVGEVAEAIKLSFKSTSKHLSILASAGIIEKVQINLYSLYSISYNQDEIVLKIIESI